MVGGRGERGERGCAGGHPRGQRGRSTSTGGGGGQGAGGGGGSHVFPTWKCHMERMKLRMNLETNENTYEIASYMNEIGMALPHG